MYDVSMRILTESWLVLGQMAPYLLFGFAVAGGLSVWVSPDWVERHLGGRGLWPVLKASLFGVPLPLCSCGVIPVGASLRRHGASRGAATAFLLSTPQTGVDSIFVTYSLLGPVFAVFRPLAALVTGVFGGALVTASDADREAPAAQPESCQEACCSGKGKRHWISRALHYGFVVLARDIAKPLLIGVVIAGLISALVPEDFFMATVGTGMAAMLVMMALGIPIYVCATASVPIAAALMLKGASPGAALAFLIAGPATNAATVTTVWKVMGRRTALLYLGTVAASAVGMGLLLDLVYTILGVPAVAHIDIHAHTPGWVHVAAAVMLLGVLIAAMWPRARKATDSAAMAEDTPSVTLSIKGMTCSHCAASVKRVLEECDGVRTADVNLASGRTEVTGDNLDTEQLTAAVAALGYAAKTLDK